MTYPLDAFRSIDSIQKSCASFYPDGAELNTCVQVRSASGQSEMFGLLVGGAIGLIIGRFVLSGRR